MTAPTTAEETLPLSQELKASTARAHDRAENSDFMTQLLDGELDTDAFIRLQEQAWLFYSALERASRAVADQPEARGIVDPRLDRADSLERDLDVLHGSSGWRATVTPTTATQAYVARLEEIAAKKDAPRLVGHHYVRYLGDMSGGQIIARMMQRHYDLPEDALSFYRFEGIGRLKPYKDAYRAALDALELTPAQRAELLDEAVEAFFYNFQVFADLEAAGR